MTPFETIQSAVQSLNWDKTPQGLYEPIDYALSSGGKRLRPALVIMASDMFGGNREKALPAALALEIFHNFTLLHDDVMDHAATRRGRPTVHKQFGTNAAILSGDQMLIEAYAQLEAIETDKLPQVIHWFSQMATQICEGQQLDVDFEQKTDVTIDDYLYMIRLKTSVLLANALRTGAYLANATTQQQDLLYKFGVNIGIAFQLQDDLLDVYGNPDTFGKKIGGDIMEGKKTFLYLTAHAQNNNLLEKALKEKDKIHAVTQVYNQLDVRQTTEKEIVNFTNKALQCLDNIQVSDNLKQPLRDIAFKLTKRND